MSATKPERKRCEAAVEWDNVATMRQCKRRGTKTVNGRPICTQHRQAIETGAVCMPEEYRSHD